MQSEARKLKIVFVSHSSGLAGSEKCLLSLVENLFSQGLIEPLVLVPKKGLLAEKLIEKKIPFLYAYRLPWWADTSQVRRRVLGPLKLAWSYLSLFLMKNKLKKFSPDVIYANTVVTSFGAMIARNLKTPLVWHIHEFIPQWSGLEFDFGRDWSLSQVDKSAAVICVSHALKNYISDKVQSPKIKVVYNGIKLPDLKGELVENKIKALKQNSDFELKLLVVGTVTEVKDHQTAIRSVAELKKDSINVNLTILGLKESTYSNKLKLLATELGVDKEINWISWRDDIWSFYEDAHITLSCGRKEGFGLSIVESMAVGTPVIGSNTGGGAEVLSKIDKDLMFKEGDSKSLAEKIKSLIANLSWYKEVSEKGRKIVVDEFGDVKYFNEIFEIVRSVTKPEK